MSGAGRIHISSTIPAMRPEELRQCAATLDLDAVRTTVQQLKTAKVRRNPRRSTGGTFG
jgi:hypothetical protein